MREAVLLSIDFDSQKDALRRLKESLNKPYATRHRI